MIIASLLTPGCGRLSFEPVAADARPGDSATDTQSFDAPAGDGRLPDGRVVDGEITDSRRPDGPVTDGSLPDGAVVGVAQMVPELSNAGASDKDPVLRFDLLEIYISSDRPGGSGQSDLWRATRARRDASWGDLMPVTELNTAESETHPTLSGDGLTLMFSRTGTRNSDIFRATRASFATPWGSVSTQDEINSGAVDGCPSLSADTLTIVFCSQRRGGTQDLHTASRSTPAETFGTVNYLGPVSTSDTELSPYVGFADQTRLLLASDRPGGMGGNDIYSATRADVGAAWGAPTQLGSVNGAANDEDPWSSNDGRLIYFASDRGGDYDIFIIGLP